MNKLFKWIGEVVVWAFTRKRQEEPFGGGWTDLGPCRVSIKGKLYKAVPVMAQMWTRGTNYSASDLILHVEEVGLSMAAFRFWEREAEKSGDRRKRYSLELQPGHSDKPEDALTIMAATLLRIVDRGSIHFTLNEHDGVYWRLG